MKSRCRELTDKAIAATVAAIEIYNKPDFPYRAETFCILAINGWELLLKAKWLHENNNKIRSLYVREPYQKKDGTPSKRLKIKRTRSGNAFTHGIDYLARKLVGQKHLDQTVLKNIEVLLELRNSSVHFYHQSDTALATQLQELGAASLKNFVLAMKDWFARDLSEFNFYLMPLSFVCLPQGTAGGNGNSQGGRGIAAQHIDPYRQRRCPAYPVNRPGHRRHCFRLHSTNAEGRIAEVFHDDAVGPTPFHGQSFPFRLLQHSVHIAAPAGRAGQRWQVNYADEDFAFAE